MISGAKIRILNDIAKFLTQKLILETKEVGTGRTNLGLIS